MSADPADRAVSPAASIVAGYLASFAMFFAGLGVIWHPLRLIPISFVFALVAAGMGGRDRRLTFVAVMFTAVCFFAGLAIATVTGKPIF